MEVLDLRCAGYGAKIDPDDKFCSYCGSTVVVKKKEAQNASVNYGNDYLNAHFNNLNAVNDARDEMLLRGNPMLTVVRCKECGKVQGVAPKHNFNFVFMIFGILSMFIFMPVMFFVRDMTLMFVFIFLAVFGMIIFWTVFAIKAAKPKGDVLKDYHCTKCNKTDCFEVIRKPSFPFINK